MSKAIRARTAASLIRDGDHLSALRRRAREQGGREEEASRLLPPALADKVCLVRDEQVMVVLAANNAVAQMVRFHADKLQRETGLQVQVRVRPERVEPPHNAPPPPQLPPEAAGCLHQAAEAVGDQDLAESLRRLASRAED